MRLAAPPPERRQPAATVTVIRPPSRLPPLHAREVWEARELLLSFARRDMKLRYRQTILGAAWVVIAPALAAAVFSFVFATVAKLPSGHIPYFLFALVGMAAWTAFSNGLGRSSQALVQNASMVTKIYFERLTLVLGAVLGGIVDLVVVLVIVAVVMAAYGIAPGWALATLPLWILDLLVLAAGLGTLSGALMVQYRDLQPIVAVGTQVLLYLSPVAYGAGVVPARFRVAYEANPLVGAISGLRWSMLGVDRPSTGATVWSVVAALAFAAIGLAVFRRQERGFADVI